MSLLLGNPFFQAHGLLAATLVLAVAVGWVTWQLVGIATCPRAGLRGAPPFESERRGTLRGGSSVYRWCEPLIDELVGLIERRDLPALRRLEQNLTICREKLPWRAEEFLATKGVEAGLIAAASLALLWLAGWTTLAVISAGIILIAGVTWAPKSIGQRATRRVARLRRRLPFAVDLIALMMEAGGGFQECLQTAVDENGDHPLTEELAEVLRQISLGRARREALEALQERLQDDDISELVFAINKGEELGTPLTSILRDQAEQMRIKRAQRGEKAAAEAQVSIVFPGMVVMIACLLVIMAPIVLPAILALWR